MKVLVPIFGPVFVTGGTEAPKSIETEKIAVIISDIRMPQMDGLLKVVALSLYKMTFSVKRVNGNVVVVLK